MANPGTIRQARFKAHYRPVIIPRILELAQQLYNQREIAEVLNSQGFRMLDGQPFNQVQISRLMRDARELLAPAPVVTPGIAIAVHTNDKPTTDTVIRDPHLAEIMRMQQADQRRDDVALQREAESRQHVEQAPPLPTGPEFLFGEA